MRIILSAPIRLALVLLAILAVVSPSTRVIAETTRLTLGEPRELPAFVFETMDGTPADLAAFKGKVTVLNLWATWCAPCRQEMPSLDRLQAEFDPARLVVVALSLDRAGSDRVTRFLSEIGVARLSVYRDASSATSRALRLPGLPATLVLDREGREVGRVLGAAEWDSPEIVASLRALVDRPPG